jgi:hypothetical protein
VGAQAFILRKDLMKQIGGFFVTSKGMRLFLAPILFRLDRCTDNDRKVIGNLLLLLGAVSMDQGASEEMRLDFTQDERDLLKVSLAAAANARLFGINGFTAQLDTALAGMSFSSDDSADSGSRTAGAAVTGSAMIRTLIGNSEMDTYPENPTDAIARAFFDKSLIGYGMSSYNDSVTWAAAGGNYARDKASYWNRAVVFDHPDDPSVFYMQGDTDAQTPHEFAEHAFEDAVIPSSKKKLMTYPGAVHGTFLMSPMGVVKGANVSTCGLWNVINFVKSEGDLSKIEDCTGDMLPLTFDCTKVATGFYDAKQCPIMARNLLGTGDGKEDGDMYEGDYQIPLQIEQIVLLVEIGLGVTICCTCFCCWACLGIRRTFCAGCCDCINCSCIAGAAPSSEKEQWDRSGSEMMEPSPLVTVQAQPIVQAQGNAAPPPSPPPPPQQQQQQQQQQGAWGMGGRDGSANAEIEPPAYDDTKGR